MKTFWADNWPGDTDDDNNVDEDREPLACDPQGLIRCPMCGLTRPARWFDETVVVQPLTLARS
jgi:hypothetical protein